MTGRKGFFLLIGVFCALSLSSLAFGQNVDVEKLVSTQDKGELNKLAAEAEKVYEKNPKDKNSLMTLGIAYHNLAILEVKKASKRPKNTSSRRRSNIRTMP